jgi:dihydrofolate synthase/folylpolyglutamate synthase
MTQIDAILQHYQHFGVNLGLKRIQTLLTALGNPHRQVPIIHVAGTNGKGSVCAYLSSVLTAAGYRVGRYTSPHLIDWCERICLNECAIAPDELEKVLLQVTAAIQDHQGNASPTQFEVITAAAWLYFSQQQVDVAVMEVGLGGRLDATNVCDRPLVSVITSISRDHWQVLGSTLAGIASEKAGILKPGCPTVVGPVPSEAKVVIAQRIADLGCPVVWPNPATECSRSSLLSHNREQDTFDTLRWVECAGIQYPLPLQGRVQLTNSAVAIAALQILQQQGWAISNTAIQQGMAKAKWPGRLQWITWQGQKLLVDGAHNLASAQALGQFVDGLRTGTSVNWIIGMLSSKEHREILEALLKKGDRLFLVPVPDHNSADPEILAKLAQEICPDLKHSQPYPNLTTALEVAYTVAHTETEVNSKSESTHPTHPLTLLCGSLYLVGHFLRSRLEAPG